MRKNPVVINRIFLFSEEFESIFAKKKTMDSEILVTLVKMKMPYGKYKGWTLCDLPEPYLVWYHSKGFPEGKLGMLLNMLYEIKLNGLEYLLEPLKKM